MSDYYEIHEIESLHYIGGTSDKVWVGAVLQHEDGKYSYMSAWGRRGAGMQSLHRDPTSLNNASSEFYAKVQEKLNKGYKKVPLDMFGIKESIQTLLTNFSSDKHDTVCLWRRPKLTTAPLPFSTQNMESAVKSSTMGMLQDVICSSVRRMVEVTPKETVTSESETDFPKQLVRVKDLAIHQMLVDGCETQDGKFAILDCYEIDNTPIGWLPYTARLGLLEKELVASGIPVTTSYMTDSIPDGGIGILWATNDTSSKLELISNLPRIKSKTVLLRDSMSRVASESQFTQLDMAAFA